MLTMTGQYDTSILVGVSMATSLWESFFLLLTGIVSGLVPIVGHHLGKCDEKKDYLRFLSVYLSVAWFIHCSFVSSFWSL